jgi:hypothetical protein
MTFCLSQNLILGVQTPNLCIPSLSKLNLREVEGHPTRSAPAAYAGTQMHHAQRTRFQCSFTFVLHGETPLPTVRHLGY